MQAYNKKSLNWQGDLYPDQVMHLGNQVRVKAEVLHRYGDGYLIIDIDDTHIDWVINHDLFGKTKPQDPFWLCYVSAAVYYIVWWALIFNQVGDVS